MDRIFLGWDQPALRLAAHALLDRYTRDTVARLDGAVVVLPGGRAGRRLKEILVEEAGARSHRLVPPRIVTLGSAPELLYEPARPLASAAESRLAWTAALRATPASRLEAVFARLPEEGASEDWLSLARDLSALHREVSRGALDFAQVADRSRSAAARGELPWDDARRWRALAEVQERYADILGQAGLLDPDLARMEAAATGALETDRDVWLLGVSEMPAVLRRMLQAVGDRVTALVHAPGELADAFDSAGCVLPGAWTERSIPLADDALSVADQPAHQAREVARHLASLEGPRTADEITVGIPDPELLPWIEERLGEAGIPVRNAAGHDVRQTGPFRLLEGMVELLGPGRWEAFSALARHPDVDRWISRHPGVEPGSPFDKPGGWLPALDEWYGQHLPAALPERFDSRRLPGRQSVRGQVVERLLELLGRELPGGLGDAPEERTLSDWVAPTLAVLARAYAHHEFDPSRPRDQRTLRALSLLSEALSGFRDLPRGLDAPTTAATALRLFLEQAAGGRIPELPDAAAVEVLGWLELHLDDAPVTVVAGVNEPALPESVNADPFLPDSLRRSLGLEDNRVRYARDAYRLTAMIHSTPVLRLVSGRRTGAGDPLRPSRLLFAAEPETVARRVLRFYREADPDGPARLPDDGTPVSAISGRGGTGPPDRASGFRLPPEAAIEPPGDPLVLRVTDFGRILSDPYTFALERYRGCAPVDDAAREMDGLVFGTLAHRVLERFGAGDGVHHQDVDVVAEELERLLGEEVRARFGPRARDAHPAVRVQVAQLLARLRRFAAWHADWIGQGWRVRAVECTTPDPGARFEVDGQEALIRARIDRVDHHPERGEWAVLDYKTGDAGDPPEKTHRKGPRSDRRWIDLQLPLYRWLLPRMLDRSGEYVAPGFHDARVGYVLLPRTLEGTGVALADWSPEDFEEALERARDVVRTLRGGPIPFQDAARPRYSEPTLDALLGLGQLAADSQAEDA